MNKQVSLGFKKILDIIKPEDSRITLTMLVANQRNTAYYEIQLQ